MEKSVLEEVVRFLERDFGNSGSRTHEYGAVANRAVEQARRHIANVVKSDPAEITFTSGATESNNLALFGLVHHGIETGRRHIVSTSIEHKAVLEPLEQLKRQGFEISLVEPNESGRIAANDVLEAIRPDTLLVSVMHANNETGVLQPIAEILEELSDPGVLFHTDAAQSFGKEIDGLRNPRIDMISISGHKIFGPKGIGALVTRRKAGRSLPLHPLMYGGGQERGLRPGTMPVALVAGLGKAAELALADHESRRKRCVEFRKRLFTELDTLNPRLHGDQNHSLPHVVNLSFGNIDSEALMLTLKDTIAISNGSACTSATYTPSHVLKAMRLSDDEAATATRWSWCHTTSDPDWEQIRQKIRMLL